MSLEKREFLIERISELVASLDNKEKKELFDRILEGKKDAIPISVFKARISGLEIVVRYLKEIKKFSFKNISKILNRSPSTIYNTYSNSKTKFGGKLDLSNDSIGIPFDIFSDRKFSVLETIAAYLKDKENLQFDEISEFLDRSPSTIRTVYRRHRIKNNHRKK